MRCLISLEFFRESPLRKPCLIELIILIKVASGPSPNHNDYLIKYMNLIEILIEEIYNIPIMIKQMQRSKTSDK